MAKAKAPAAKPAPKAAPALKAAKGSGKTKKVSNDEEKAARRQARMEAIKKRPPGQRTNSKQIDVIELPNGNKVLVYGASIRKQGTVVTAVTTNSDNKVLTAPSVTFVAGVKVKSKKGHGYLQFGVAGIGKKGKGKSNSNDADDEDDDEDDED
jgi:hypothetical protein